MGRAGHKLQGVEAAQPVRGSPHGLFGHGHSLGRNGGARHHDLRCPRHVRLDSIRGSCLPIEPILA